MSVLALVAYVTIMAVASDTFRRQPPGNSGEKYLDRRNFAAWCLAMFSTFGLPWGGAPISRYLGAGSWTWFALACASLCVARGDGTPLRRLRVTFAIANVAVIMAAVYAFMYTNGVPGDIPGIEGVAVINSLEGLNSWKLRAARAIFMVSAAASFLPVHSVLTRTSAMLSFSYSSFLSIAFMPPAWTFLRWLRPEAAIMAGAAAYFLCALAAHKFVIGGMSEAACSMWNRRYAAVNFAATAAGIYFLFLGT